MAQSAENPGYVYSQAYIVMYAYCVYFSRSNDKLENSYPCINQSVVPMLIKFTHMYYFSCSIAKRENSYHGVNQGVEPSHVKFTHMDNFLVLSSQYGGRVTFDSRLCSVRAVEEVTVVAVRSFHPSTAQRVTITV